MRSRIEWVICLAVIGGSVLGSACKDAGTEPERFVPTATGIAVSSVVTWVYDDFAIPLGAQVVDQRGLPLPDEPILWISRDPTTALVDQDGWVRGRAAGDVWIVAASGSLADSVQISVRFFVEANQVRIRVQGAVELNETWEGAPVPLDFLGTAEGDMEILSGRSSDWRSYFVAGFPGTLHAEGDVALREFDPSSLWSESTFDLSDPLAYFAIEESSERMHLYRAAGSSHVGIDSISTTPEGERMVWGNIVLEADGFLGMRDANWDFQFTPTGEQIRLDASFAVPTDPWPVGMASLQISEAGETVAGDRREAWWHYTQDDPVRGYVTIEDGPPWVQIYTDLTEGAFPIEAVGVNPSADLRSGPGIFVVAHLENGSAESVEGVLILEPLASSGYQEYQVLAGQAVVELVMQDRLGETVSLSVDFYAPVFDETARTQTSRQWIETEFPLLRRLPRSESR